jgi:hypothetical protein
MAITVEGQYHNSFNKPYDFTGGGHYRVNHRCALVALQAANSRLFSLRNPSTTLVTVITRLTLQWIQTAAHTAAIEDSLDLFKVTGFTALDGVNTVTPVASVMRTAGMTVPASAASTLRGVTIAGASAGMTGGTLVKDTSSIAQLPLWLTLAFVDPAQRSMAVLETGDRLGEHPLVLAADEGIILENRALLGAAAGSSVYIDLSYLEVNLANF